MPLFVGRAEPLARLVAAYDACCGSTPPASDGGGGVSGAWSGLCVVPGASGTGKTALVRRFAEVVGARGAVVVWGTCWDAEQAPAWWPWTQALRTLVDRRPEVADEAAAELRPILTGTGSEGPSGGDAQDASVRARVLLAASDLVARASEHGPVVVVLDDLQWGDASSLELLRFLARNPQQRRVLVVAAYRSDELAAPAAGDLADVAAAAEVVPLQALRLGDVRELVAAVAGPDSADRWAELVHRRSEGHPFFARELAHLIADGDPGTDVPVVVRDAVLRRVERLSGPCRAVLGAAAVAGRSVSAPLLAGVTGLPAAEVSTALADAAAAGILTEGVDEHPSFVHDLYRETLYRHVGGEERVRLHHAVGRRLAAPGTTGRVAFASELARHFTAAVPVSGAGPALAWSRAAAEADAARFAFVEAAGQLGRARAAVLDAGADVEGEALTELLVEEAAFLVRGGQADRARDALEQAWARAVASGDGGLLGRVALGLVDLGARFATPRTELVRVLEHALRLLTGTGTAEEAAVTAALARQLQHGVPADRPRASPLAQRAVAIARDLDDPRTLMSCLLAAHDVLWTPGTAAERAVVAAEIADLARRTGDAARLAQALLLVANAQLETGSPAFRATLAESLLHTEAQHEPRADYVAATRRAAVILLDGDLEAGDRESRAAEQLGLRCGDTDTGNVRMSQRLEVVRAGGDRVALQEFAREAVAWWVGAPVHAHAVAAGFHARAGDLVEARRELDVVAALDWRTDRSYLWSVFVGEIATAAIAVGDVGLCREVLEDLRPVAGSCAVNGALVCFMGSHELTVGRLLAALGDHAAAREHLGRAVEVHRRLGARLWEEESRRELAALEGVDAAAGGRPVLRRTGDLWELRYAGRTSVVRDSKGMRDLSVLLGRPGQDVPAAELTGHDAVHAAPGAPVLDRTALAAYRTRLAELDEELEDARQDGDLGREERAASEREAILAELRSQTRPDGSSRGLGATTVERARKAVSARIRDAIARVAEGDPELGAHLDRSIRTGTSCRYEPSP